MPMNRYLGAVLVVGLATAVMGAVSLFAAWPTVGVILLSIGSAYIATGVLNIRLAKNGEMSYVSVALMGVIAVSFSAFFPEILVSDAGLSIWRQRVIRRNVGAVTVPWAFSAGAQITAISTGCGVLAYVIGVEQRRETRLRLMAVIFLVGLYLITVLYPLLVNQTGFGWLRLFSHYVVLAATMLLALPLYHLGKEYSTQICTTDSRGPSSFVVPGFVVILLLATMIASIISHPAGIISSSTAVLVVIATVPACSYLIYYLSSPSVEM